MSLVEDFAKDGVALKFAEIVYQRCLVSATSLLSIWSLSEEHSLAARESNDECMSDVATEEGDWDLEE